MTWVSAPGATLWILRGSACSGMLTAVEASILMLLGPGANASPWVPFEVTPCRVAAPEGGLDIDGHEAGDRCGVCSGARSWLEK